MRLLTAKKIYFLNFAADNEGRENGSKESGTWHLSLDRLCALSLLPSGFSPPFHSLHSSLSSGFILADQGVFCQVSPIKFALHEHLRTSRYLKIPSTNETEAPVRISCSPPMRDFRSFFPRFRSLFSFLLLPRCFRQKKSSSFVRLATRSRRVVEIFSIFLLTRRNADSMYEIDDWLSRPDIYYAFERMLLVFNIAIDAVNYI